MKNIILTAITLLALQIPQSGFSQGEGLTSQITAARKANAGLMKQYSWNCRTEFVDGGKVEDIRIDLVTYGPDGNLQRTVLNNDQSSLPRGFIRRRLAERKAKDVEKYLDGLRKLLEQYTLPTAGKILDFIDGATIQAPDSNGLLQLTGSSVVSPGDSYTLAIDAKTKQPRSVTITTFFEGDVVQANASFKTLKSGLNHVAFAEISVPSKQITLQIHNFDYNPNN